MKGLVAAISLVAGLFVSRPPAEIQTPSAFSIALEATPTGWAARCDSGCRWHEAAFACPTACGAIVDANGIVTTPSARPEPTAFSFSVEHLPNGARAESRIGTVWKSLSWECRTTPCRVRVNETGVSADPRGR